MAGAGWAGIAGLLKATVGAHEVISTIMLNYTAVYIGLWLFSIDGPLQNDRDASLPVSNDIVEGAKLPVFWGDPMLQGLHIGIFIALIAVGLFWLLLNRSTVGYEVRAVGLNPEAARYSGMNVGKNYVLVMAVCGLFAGLAGALDVLGWQFRVATNDIQASTVGFTGIAVALLGRSTASGTVAAALLWGALVSGTSQRNLDPTIFEPTLAFNLTLIIQGLVVLLVSADVLVLSLLRRGRRRLSGRRRSGSAGRGGRGVSAHALAAPRELLAPRYAGWAGVALGAVAWFIALPPLMLRTPVPSLLLAAAAVGAGVMAWRGGERRLGGWAAAAGVLGGIGAVVATRSGEGNLEDVFVWSALAAAMLRFATPLIFGALGGIVCERSGVINIGLEGMMLMGAFFGIFGADFTGSWLLGALVGMAAGAALALVHAVFSVSFRADQVVSGFALNLLALGITGYVFIAHYGDQGTPDGIPRAPEVTLPLVESIPFVGDAIGQANILTWVALLLVPLAGRPLVSHPAWPAAALRGREAAGGRERGRAGHPHALSGGCGLGDPGGARAASICRSPFSARSART